MRPDASDTPTPDSPPALETSVTVEIENHHVVVFVRGQIDADTCDQLRLALDEAVRLGGRITVDFSGTTFTDSSGLQVLLAAYRELGQLHEAMALRGVNGHVARLLEITGTDKLFMIRPNVAAG